jgi:hypothetical protein
MANAEVLARAVRCYRDAGLDEDACRCLERLEDFPAAAAIHERLGHTLEAAGCFERAGDLPAAARCYQAGGADEDALRCLDAAGRPVDAAWVAAHRLRRPDRALAMLARAAPLGPDDALAADLVRGRCGGARSGEAAAAVHRVLTWLPGQPAGPQRDRLVAWALTLARLIDRPDLSAGLFAALVAAGQPGAAERWEDWARRRLGSVDGIPLAAGAADLADSADSAGSLESYE